MKADKTRRIIGVHQCPSVVNQNPMKSIVPVLVAAMFASAVCAQQQKQAEKVGLAGVLADDEKLIAELSKRELNTLRDYMFVKNGISKEQQAAYLAVSSVK